MCFGEAGMMFDTDVLIFVQRGNTKAARLIDQTEERKISVQTILELLQSARNKEQHRVIQKFITDFGFSILPFTENIGHRAMVYIEEYGLSSGLRAGDAIVAATASENRERFCTANMKHFRNIKNLDLYQFRP